MDFCEHGSENSDLINAGIILSRWVTTSFQQRFCILRFIVVIIVTVTLLVTIAYWVSSLKNALTASDNWKQLGLKVLITLRNETIWSGSFIAALLLDLELRIEMETNYGG
jgi:hypothetical protein